ncbi:MAG: type II toxin-antitoxin system VapC family toxin [Burkholderiales bacterium]|nr:type II toxin-antitoxin system VapC family toxin [Phycisphaerae bacterium]
MIMVVDMSVVLAWYFEEAQTSKALGVLKLIGKNGVLVPELWWCELENGILMGERRARKTPTDSAAFLKLVRALPIETDQTPRRQISDRILDLGRQHQLTAYDATYLELAIRETVPLATFDEALRRSARAMGVSVMPTAG